MTASVEVAEGSEGNAFAQMLADLVRQNLESKPHKCKDFHQLVRTQWTVALVADDADVAATLAFGGAGLVLYDGIRGVPDVTVRGSSDAIMGLSNVPLTRPFPLPIPTDRASLDVLRDLARAARRGELRVHGMLWNFGSLGRLTRVMSVNG